jgi:hypothetical protein
MSEPQHRLLLAAALVATTLASANARADEALMFGNPDYFCRNGAFPGGGEYDGERPTFRLARVTGRRGAITHFYSEGVVRQDAEACTDLQGTQCEANGQLQTGDTVIVSKTVRGFACAWFEPTRQRGQGRETVGWLPLSSLAFVDEPKRPPSLKRWLGTWRHWDDRLVIGKSADRNALNIKGTAYWPARNLAPFHSGFLSGNAEPVGNTVTVVYPPDSPPGARCELRLTLLGDLLVASDNHRCGGMNVVFDGVFVDRPSK